MVQRVPFDRPDPVRFFGIIQVFFGPFGPFFGRLRIASTLLEGPSQIATG